MTHPYKDLDDFHFWSRAMLIPAPGQIDPVTKSKIIKPLDKVATMGSCFAQHLSRNISAAGFNYFVPEAAPRDLAPEEAIKKNYGIFSARYGNVYTARQAIQLFDRAFQIYEPEENIWQHQECWVDAFRPQIQANGFTSKDLLLESRKEHLGYVRQVFQESDWLIFTLGLTEAWMSKKDGAIFPVAPGVSGGSYSEDEIEFINFSVQEVISDLTQLVQKISSINPTMNIILTVSPVPLIATYENRHVLVSTTASKAVLRVAADEMERQFNNVIYFPSYEIINSPASNGRYFQDDLRQVTDIGVNHVMRIFHKHFMQTTQENEGGQALNKDLANSGSATDLVCDENEIESAMKRSGF